jgi:hypothetical protein
VATPQFGVPAQSKPGTRTSTSLPLDHAPCFRGIRPASSGLADRTQHAALRAGLSHRDPVKQYRGQDSLQAEIEFAAGVLKVRPGSPGSLYRMELSYDPQRFAPLSKVDSSGTDLRLGIKSSGQAGISVGLKNDRPRDGLIELNPRTILSSTSPWRRPSRSGSRWTPCSQAEIRTGASETTLGSAHPTGYSASR